MPWVIKQQSNTQQPSQKSGGRWVIKNQTSQPQQQPQVQPQQNWLQKLGNFVKPMIQAGKETGAAIADVGLRTNPLELARRSYAGIKGGFTPQAGENFSSAAQRAADEFSARQLLFEKLTGKNVTKPTGGVDWQTGRQFVGRAMEAPTYLYAGTKGFLGNPTGNLGSRLLSRSTAVLPEAGVITGIQQFEQGDLKNAPSNFARNAIAMALLSNLFGEAGRSIRGGKMMPPQTAGTAQFPLGRTATEGQGIIPQPLPQPKRIVPPPQSQLASELSSRSYKGIQPPKGKSVKPLQEGGKIGKEAQGNLENMARMSGNFKNFEKGLSGTTGSQMLKDAGISPKEFYNKATQPPQEGVTPKLTKAEKLKQSIKEGTEEFQKEINLTEAKRTEIVKNRMAKEAMAVEKTITENENLVIQRKRAAQQLRDTLKAEGGFSKERGFAKSMANSPELSTDMSKIARQSPESQYIIKHREPGQVNAQKLILNNPTEAERIALGGTDRDAVLVSNELIKNYDTIAQNAKRSGDINTFNAAMDKAQNVAIANMKRGTELGQAVDAYKSIGEMSPDGIFKVVNKTIKDSGLDNFKLDNQKTFEFVRKAESIQQILNPKEKALAVMDLMDDIYKNIPQGNRDKIYEVLNLPRAIMATADLSAPLRQGIFTMARHPIIFAKNFGRMLKYFVSEKAYRNLQADILTSPNWNLYKKYKLPLTDIHAGLTGREERFMSTLAEKIPVFGRISKASNRAYTGFLNKMRADLMDDFINTAKLNKITDEKFFESAADFVGAATGRGKLGRFEDAAKLLNTTFFSPRLMASRFNLLNPRYYSKLHPAVRKEALKSLAAFVGTGAGVLALAKANGAEVGADPRSADFGKIKIGNTRFDIWGGFQPYARLVGQLVTGEKISTITGKQTTLGQGFGAPTRESIIMDFLKSKESPILSLITRLTQGEQYGEKLNISKELIDRFIPMVIADAYDLYKEKGNVTGAIPAVFGVGVQTYGKQIPKLEKTPSGAPTLKWRQESGLGEDILNKLMGTQLTNIPKEEWPMLQEERQADVTRQINIDAAKARVLETGKPETIEGTLIYLQNGIVKIKSAPYSAQRRMPTTKKVLNPFYQ